jgi:hypothetical protein
VAKKNRGVPGAVTAAPAPAATVPLPALAAELGLAVDRVEHLAGLACVPGDDFTDTGDSAIEFTVAGAKKIRDRVAEEMRDHVETKTPAATVAAATPAVPAPRTEDLRLTRVFQWSKNVLAELPNRNEVVLSVKSAKFLMPGMVLRGCREGEGGWFYQGRLPRTLGERQMFFPGYVDPETKGEPCKNNEG